jgi:hypothetical protein
MVYFMRGLKNWKCTEKTTPTLAKLVYNFNNYGYNYGYYGYRCLYR